MALDDEEREALRAEGFDPDDPAVKAAIDLVRWELSAINQPGRIDANPAPRHKKGLLPRPHLDVRPNHVRQPEAVSFRMSTLVRS